MPAGACSACNWRFLLPLAWLCVSLLLAGCTGTPPPQHPLSDLHLTNVVRLTGFDSLIAQSDRHRLQGLAVYQDSFEPDDLRILTVLDQQVYDGGSDGSRLHAVTLEHPCLNVLAVTPDSQHVACNTPDGTQVFVPTPTPDQPVTQRLILSNKDASHGTPSWGGEGRYLALATGRDELDAIGVYAVSTTFQTATLVATISLPGLLVLQVSWSPDNEWIVFQGGATDGGFRTYGFRLQTFLPILPRFGAVPMQVTIALSALIPLGPEITGVYAWKPQSETLTFAAPGGSIVSRDMGTGQEHTLLAQKSGAICSLAWSPDGKQLVFELCGPGDVEFTGPPSQIYLYTPPS